MLNHLGTVTVPEDTVSVKVIINTRSSTTTKLSVLSYATFLGIEPIYDSGWINDSSTAQIRTFQFDNVPQGSYNFEIHEGFASSQSSSLS